MDEGPTVIVRARECKLAMGCSSVSVSDFGLHGEHLLILPQPFSPLMGFVTSAAYPMDISLAEYAKTAHFHYQFISYLLPQSLNAVPCIPVYIVRHLDSKHADIVLSLFRIGVCDPYPRRGSFTIVSTLASNAPIAPPTKIRHIPPHIHASCLTDILNI